MGRRVLDGKLTPPYSYLLVLRDPYIGFVEEHPMQRRISAVIAALLFVLLASAAGAQEARGTIQGRVTDSSGAAVPGATVEVFNLATGVATTTNTNAALRESAKPAA